MHTLLSAVLTIAHITMVLDDFPDMFRGKLLLSCIHKCCSPATVTVLTALRLFPLACFSCQFFWRQYFRLARRWWHKPRGGTTWHTGITRRWYSRHICQVELSQQVRGGRNNEHVSTRVVRGVGDENQTLTPESNQAFC